MEIDGDVAELLGIHIGDGCISINNRYHEYYLGGDIIEERKYHDEWVSKLFDKKIALPILKKKINYKEHPKVGIYGFHIFDRRIVEFFKKLGISHGSKINIGIPNYILKNNKLSKRFLRGLFDTDGNIYFDKNRSAKIQKNNRPIIKLSGVSEKLIKGVYNLLVSLGFHPRMKKKYKGKRDKNFVHSLLIYRIKDVENYIREIGFKNPKHYTKWQIYKKLGFCPPNTKLKERLSILKT